jgi:hypothetical protein
VFVDLGTGPNVRPSYWIVPRSWVQNMVYDHKQAWIKKRGNRARSAGAEWTLSFPIRDESRRVTGGGSGANLAKIVYEPLLN